MFQIFKISSVFCLVVASFERYMITSHWTFSGFDQRTRWIVLAVVVFVAIAIRLIISIVCHLLLGPICLTEFLLYY
jgi:uncharacterized membrane protein